jgi:hypothetical protein
MITLNRETPPSARGDLIGITDDGENVMVDNGEWLTPFAPVLEDDANDAMERACRSIWGEDAIAALEACTGIKRPLRQFRRGKMPDVVVKWIAWIAGKSNRRQFGAAVVAAARGGYDVTEAEAKAALDEVAMRPSGDCSGGNRKAP